MVADFTKNVTENTAIVIYSYKRNKKWDVYPIKKRKLSVGNAVDFFYIDDDLDIAVGQIKVMVISIE